MTTKQRNNGVYIIRRWGYAAWAGSWNGWHDAPDDHTRLEWIDRAKAVKVLRALRRLIRQEGMEDVSEIKLCWAKYSKNRDLPHYGERGLFR